MSDRTTLSSNGKLTALGVRIDRELETVRIRKRKQDKKLAEIRFRDTAKYREEQIRKGVNAIAKLCESTPTDLTYRSKMEKALKATHAVRCALVEHGADQIIDSILDAGLIKFLLSTLELPHQYNHLKHDETIGKLQSESAWCLTNIATNKSGVSSILEFPGSLEVAGRVLTESNFPAVREQMAWFVGNLGGHDLASRQRLRNDVDVVEALTLCIRGSPTVGLLQNSLWAASNVIFGNQESDMEKVRDVLLSFKNILDDAMQDNVVETHVRDSILQLIFKGLQNGMFSNQEAVEFVGLSDGFIAHVLSVVRHARNIGHIELIISGMRCLGLTAKGSEELKQALIDNNYLSQAVMLLQYGNERVSKEVCIGLADLIQTADTKRLRKFSRTRNMFPTLLRVANDQGWTVKKSAYEVLYNYLCAGEHDHHKDFIKYGGMQVLCDSIKVTQDIDVMICARGLDAIIHLLRVDRANKQKLRVIALIDEHDGLKTIEELAIAVNAKIFKRAVLITEEYFNANDENMGCNF